MARSQGNDGGIILMTVKISISPIWKDRILDLIRIANVLLSFYTMWLVNSGDHTKYNIPLIITIFMIVNIVLTIMLGEKVRSSDPVLMKLELDYQELKKKEKN